MNEVRILYLGFLQFDVNICMKHLAELSISGPTTEQCHQQRAALIKSLLNFIKRVVQDAQFADSIRHSRFIL